jgi:stage II sporulation protein D
MNYIRVCHKLEIINNQKQFVVYADYPFEYEFGMDFDVYKQKVKDVSSSIRQYIKKNLGSVKDATVMLVLNGVIMGTFALSQVLGPNVKAVQVSETDLVAQVADESQNIMGEDATSQDTLANNVNKVEESSKIEQEKNNEKLDDIVNSAVTSTAVVASTTNETKVMDLVNKKSSVTNNLSEVKNNKNNPNINGNTNSNKNNNNNNNKVNNTSSSVSNSNSNVTNQGKTINIRLNTGETINIALEDYVIGVVGSEMPALFNSEALKSQAVAARTYALKKTSTGATLTATTSDQVYKTNDELKAMWGNSYNTYYNKVKNAVLATSGEVMTYNGSYIDAVYFSTSNGRTEDPVYVWKYAVPYLKSVDSKWDVGTKFFNATKTISKSEISSKLGVNLTSVSEIKINSLTTGGRVNSVTIAGKEFTGVQIRTLLGLRSADFTVSESGNNIVFTTKGWGHGVGMSQYGANAMANAGYNYSQILKHYYTGISIIRK